MTSCMTCRDEGTIEVPVRDDTDLVPCPHCRPEMWPDGFPGVRAGDRIIIQASKHFRNKDWSNQ